MGIFDSLTDEHNQVDELGIRENRIDLIKKLIEYEQLNLEILIEVISSFKMIILSNEDAIRLKTYYDCIKENMNNFLKIIFDEMEEFPDLYISMRIKEN